jgi:hypothetical protein
MWLLLNSKAVKLLWILRLRKVKVLSELTTPWTTKLLLQLSHNQANLSVKKGEAKLLLKEGTPEYNDELHQCEGEALVTGRTI